MEIRKAPNDTAALSFVANSEAARYVFVVVVVHDVMIAGRRYDTFVLACPRALYFPSGRDVAKAWQRRTYWPERLPPLTE